jgi:hypothetical protein
VRVLLSKIELDSISASIKKAQPHKVIMKEHGIIYDKGTTFARMRNGSKINTLSESANESFTKTGWKQFSLIYSTVNRIVRRNIEKEKIELTINLNCTGANIYWLNLQANQTNIGLLGCNDTSKIIQFKLLPGKYVFYAHIFKSENGLYKYPQKTWPFNQQEIQIKKDTIINFQLKDSILELKR